MKQLNFTAMNPDMAKAIEQMQGEQFSLEKINFAELERRTGISRQKLCSLKEKNFEEEVPHTPKGRKVPVTLLSGYTWILDGLLKADVTNSAVCLRKLRECGFKCDRLELCRIGLEWCAGRMKDTIKDLVPPMTSIPTAVRKWCPNLMTVWICYFTFARSAALPLTDS